MYCRLVQQLQTWDFQVCAVFVLDAGYMVDAARFLSGSLAALATMVQLEVRINLCGLHRLIKPSDSAHVYVSADIFRNQNELYKQY